MKEITITFLPDGKATVAEAGITLQRAAEQAGVYISSLCGGEGTCGKCRILVRQGEVRTPPSALLSQAEIEQGYVLACQARAYSDLLVEVPLESQWEGRALLSSLDAVRFGQILPCHPDARPYREEALSRKEFLSLPAPTLADHLSDWERVRWALRKALGAEQNLPPEGLLPVQDLPVSLDLPTLQKLPRLLRENGWQITATLGALGTSHCRYFSVLDLEPGDTSGRNYGVAVDIGTTTVVAHLVDLVTGRTVGQQGRYNSQIRYGEDVISRIAYSTEEKDGLRKLQTSIVRDINQLVGELCAATGARPSDISYLVCAGNPTMIHFLLGLEATYIRREPYIPAVQYPPVVRAAEVGIHIHERGLLRCLPGVGAYVGADITAGILASGLHQSSELALFFDIGTNGEVVLGNRDWLICCSASAGPAFEGGEMKSGMRAAAGAIERVSLGADGRVFVQVIGGGKPQGLCGSGLIDCVAELAKWGYVDRAGKFRPERDRRRLRQGELEWEFVLVPAEDSETGRDLVITQSDIDVFLRSKGAVYTAAESLVSHLGLSFADLDRVYIAGGFGNYLDLRNSISIGLMPDLPLEKFYFLGNASLAGAKMGLLSREALEESEKIAAKMTYFDLSTDPKFMNEFVSSLFLPHTDLEKFPSVSLMAN